MPRGKLRFLGEPKYTLEGPLGTLWTSSLQGWELPEEFGMLRRLLESRMGRRGKREYVQVLRLLETFS